MTLFTREFFGLYKMDMSSFSKGDWYSIAQQMQNWGVASFVHVCMANLALRIKKDDDFKHNYCFASAITYALFAADTVLRGMKQIEAMGQDTSGLYMNTAVMGGFAVLNFLALDGDVRFRGKPSFSGGSDCLKVVRYYFFLGLAYGPAFYFFTDKLMEGYGMKDALSGNAATWLDVINKGWGIGIFSNSLALYAALRSTNAHTHYSVNRLVWVVSAIALVFTVQYKNWTAHEGRDVMPMNFNIALWFAFFYMSGQAMIGAGPKAVINA